MHLNSDSLSRACKTFWMKVRMNRRQNGISPALPDPQDRPAMKKLYMQTGKIPLTPEG